MPKAQNVEIKIGDTFIQMSPKDSGWWSVDVRNAKPGMDYAYILDGRQPLPDPRSPWQPHCVHGPSRLVDLTAFSWTDTRWQPRPLSSAIMYELHVGTFTPEGTFEAIIPRLDHLVDLGITHIELMPVNEFSGSRGWGYDGVDLYAPHQAYGGPKGLQRLVDACHHNGLAVILDVVYNHLGPVGNYLEQFGPYFTERYQTPWGRAVNLDGPDSDEVRRFFIDNALLWLRDYHVDGLRLDAVHAFVDTSAVHFLEELAEQVHLLEAQLGRHLVVIAESNLNDPRIVRPREIGGYGIDAQWHDDFHHALHTVLTGEHGGYYEDFGTLTDLAKAFQHGFVYDGCYSVFRNRKHGRSATGLSGHQFIGFLQNHDQIGNRAKGERICHLITPGRLKIGAALLFTAPFIPMLFQGEEWGASSPFLYFTDHDNPKLGRAVREGRRKEFAAFGWNPEEIPDPQAPETFQHSKLNWSELVHEPHASLLDWYRRLIQLRRTSLSLCDGRMENVHVTYHEVEQWVLVQRGSVLIVCNLSNQKRTIAIPERGVPDLILTSENDVKMTSNAIRLPSESVTLLNYR